MFFDLRIVEFLFFFLFFFFFKQKTAYEIKECDWSSDVCSSDLWNGFGSRSNVFGPPVRRAVICSLQTKEEEKMKRIKADELILSVFVVLVLSMSGCATIPTPVRPAGLYYDVKVESIAVAGADLKNKTYVLTSALKKVSVDDIQFKEFARYIENAMSKKGYTRVGSKNADLIIRLAYGVGEPKIETDTQSYTASAGYSYQVGWTWIHVPPQTKTVKTETTSYERFLILEAYDSKDRRSQLWRTRVTSWGWGTDLRIVLPRMIAAATYNFGTNTIGKPIYTRIYTNAARVLDIMRSSDAHSEDAFTEKNRLGVMLELQIGRASCRERV